jgi:electron transfer flavoprotein alpha subunit
MPIFPLPPPNVASSRSTTITTNTTKFGIRLATKTSGTPALIVRTAATTTVCKSVAAGKVRTAQLNILTSKAHIEFTDIKDFQHPIRTKVELARAVIVTCGNVGTSEENSIQTIAASEGATLGTIHPVDAECTTRAIIRIENYL